MKNKKDSKLSFNWKLLVGVVVQRDKVLSVVLIISILGALGMLGYVIANPKSSEKFTEFYILGVDAQASNYPTELTLGETATVIVGIVNHEQENANYRVEIISAGTLIGELDPIVLQDGQGLEREINFTPVVAGENQKVEFLLFMEKATGSYRSLHLYINVVEN